jgi:hypothetical protein
MLLPSVSKPYQEHEIGTSTPKASVGNVSNRSIVLEVFDYIDFVRGCELEGDYI